MKKLMFCLMIGVLAWCSIMPVGIGAKEIEVGKLELLERTLDTTDLCGEDGCTQYFWWDYEIHMISATWIDYCYNVGAAEGSCSVNNAGWDGAGSVWCQVSGFDCTNCVVPEQEIVVDWSLAKK